MTNATHDRMHELLCAYVLGEATADERAEVERALSSSPELAREKERIEATIGLVQGAMGKNETLSDARREEVLRAVVPPSARPWWKETWVRAAAGILFVSFALGGWSVYEQRQRAEECAVAQRERTDDSFDRYKTGANDARGFAGEQPKDLDGRIAGLPEEPRKGEGASGRGRLIDVDKGEDRSRRDAEDALASAKPEGATKKEPGFGFLGGLTPAEAKSGPPATLSAQPEPSAGTRGLDAGGANLGVDRDALVQQPGDAGSNETSKNALRSLTAGGVPASDPGAPQVTGGGGGGTTSATNLASTQTLSFDTEFGAGNPFEKLDVTAGTRAVDAQSTYYLGAQAPTGGPGGSSSPGSAGAAAPGAKDGGTQHFDRFAGRPAGAPAPARRLTEGEKLPQGGTRGGAARAAGGEAHLGKSRSTDLDREQKKQVELREQLAQTLHDQAGALTLVPTTKDDKPGVWDANLPGNTGSEVVLFEELDDSAGIDLRAFDVPQFKGTLGFSVDRQRLLDDMSEGEERARLSDEDRFILTQLGLQPGQELPPITLELRLKYRDAYVDHWCQRIRRHCERRPDEKPRDMFFRFWGDNPFELSALDPLSTFSADVDTASYALARRYLREGKIPEKAQVRTEEFVNSFKADVPPPTQGTFGITATLAPSRYGAANPGEATTSAHDLLRVVIRGKDVAKTERKPLALTFVVDVSGSMKEQNRIEMVKHAMRLLVSQLDARDSIAIVKFSTDASMVLPMTSAKNKDQIESAIFPLAAEGSTNSEAGLRMGYAAALTGLNVEATNRVVLLSDGVANVGVTDPNVISEGVKQLREKGIYLNTIGVGMNNHNDVLLEQLADKGDGVCNYVDGPDEAKKVFVDQFMGTVETIARDVKLQVEFDPAQVFRYRLLGYENRAVADADFRNDKVDAGEVGAGHQVTALYEIEYAPQSKASEKPLATVRVRYKAPRNPNAPTANEEATELAQTVTVAQRTSWEGAGPGYRKAAIVAQFAEFLRRSIHARNDSFDQLIADAKKLESETKDAEFSEFVTLLDQSKALILNGWPNRDELALAVDQIRENYVLRSQLERLAAERDKEVLAELEKSNREMEARLREMLRRRLEQPR
ncbi:MAG: von Willebrand factor type A domain-containing protein [Planctomycetes bacterium]|nr:von Willebrand factor type A domain-containing protein [Planctomycetota bacterium]